MKSIYVVLQQKELEIERLKKEIEALRIVVPMLGDDETARQVASPSPARTYYMKHDSEPVVAGNTAKPTGVVWP